MLARAVVGGMVELLGSGPHTVVWAQISVDQKPFIAWFVQRHVGLMALAIGDGVNDVGMIKASLGLYKILFHFNALLWESTILLWTPSTCKAYPFALLHDHCATYDPPTAPPCMPYTIQSW